MKLNYRSHLTQRFALIAFAAVTFASVSPQTTFGQATAAQGSASSTAESADTVAVVAIAPLGELFDRIKDVSEWTGNPQFGGIASMMARPYTAGLDEKRPLGIAVTFDASNNPIPVAMLPVSNLETFFEGVSNFGQPEDLGDGFYAMNIGPQPIFAHQVGDWLYVAQQEEYLDNVPADPAQLLSKMAARFVISARINAQNIPSDFREMFIEQARQGYERASAEQQQGMPASSAAMSKMSGEQMMATMENAIRETDQVVLGWAVDNDANNMYIDLATQFVEGSELAKQTVAQKAAVSKFGAFENEEAAISSRATLVIPGKDVEAAQATIAQSIQAVKDQLSSESNNEELNAAVFDLLDELGAVYVATLETGVLDFGTTLDLGGTDTLALGAKVAEGRRLEKAVKDFVGKVGSAPGAPQIKFDAETYKGVTFHTGTLDLPPNAPPSVTSKFGNPIEFVIGTADDAVYAVVGKSSVARLKSMVDAGSDSTTTVSPFNTVINVRQLIEFANEVNPQAQMQMMLDNLDANRDQLTITSRIVPRGVIYRVLLNDGVLKAIGKSVTGGGGQGGF
jgi:hypothetical protein